MMKAMRLVLTIALLLVLTMPPGAARAQVGAEILWIQGGHSGPIQSIALSPDGQWIASGSKDGTIKIWRAADGKLLRTMTIWRWVRSVAFSPDGQLLALGTADWSSSSGWLGQVQIRRASDGVLLRTFARETKGVFSVAFSPDGRYLATGGGDGTVRIWRVLDRKEIYRFNAHPYGVSSVAFSPDGRFVVSGGSDYDVKVWRISDGTQVASLPHGSPWSLVAFSPSGQWVASAGGQAVKIWQVGTWELFRTFTQTLTFSSVSFSPDGQLVAAGGSSGSGDAPIWVWRVSNGAPVASLAGFKDAVTSVAFSRDGQLLAGSGGVGTLAGYTALKVWRVSGWTARTFTENMGYITSIAFSPDGQQVAAATGGSFTIKLWNTLSGSEVRTFILNPPKYPFNNSDIIHAITFSPNGQWLAAGFGYPGPAPWNRPLGGARIFRVSDGTEISSLYGPLGPVVSVAFSPNGQYLAMGSNESYFDNVYARINLWQVSDGTSPITPTLMFGWEAFRPAISSVAFSPDGRYLAAGGTDSGGYAIKLWQVSDGTSLITPTLRFTITASMGRVRSLAFSTDGRYLASGNDDRLVWLWRVSDGTSLITPTLVFTGTGHTSAVLSVAFSPDGQYLVSGSGKEVVVRRASDGTPLQTYLLQEQGLGVSAVGFSPDRRFFAYGRADGPVLMARNPFFGP